MSPLKTDTYLVIEARRRPDWTVASGELPDVCGVKVVRALQNRPAKLDRDQIAVRVQLTVEAGAFSPIVADLALHVDTDAVARAVVEQLDAKGGAS
ncbi:hypothetical protein TSOC111612_01470 [Tsukamurella ocularis]|uniref:hypothetical protein n=1 Tax=Tsukamurella ocularis TaxID=1970234 RepID=UPI0039EEF64E